MKKYIDADEFAKNLIVPKDSAEDFRKGVDYVLEQLASIPSSKEVFTMEDIDGLQDRLIVKLSDIEQGSASYSCYDGVIHGIGYIKDRLRAGKLRKEDQE